MPGQWHRSMNVKRKIHIYSAGRLVAYAISENAGGSQGNGLGRGSYTCIIILYMYASLV